MAFDSLTSLRVVKTECYDSCLRTGAARSMELLRNISLMIDSLRSLATSINEFASRSPHVLTLFGSSFAVVVLRSNFGIVLPVREIHPAT